MSGFVNFNGKLLPADTFSIMAGNRSYLYGDGLFETIRVVNGRPINLDNHYKRLTEGMDAIKMKPPANFSTAFFEAEIHHLVSENQITGGGWVRMSIDRKPGGKYLPDSNHVDFYIEAHPLDNNQFVLNDRGYRVDLYDDIKDFNKGFDTVLGERGITLSGGQKQRLSIARAIYGDPKVLVFDDSFSAVDTHTEAAILEGLSNYIHNRTTLLISHRVSTVKNADFIIVMDKGKVIEQGTHDELIENHLYYYSLYKKQLLEKELKDS